MRTFLEYLVLPAEISDFERGYLSRLNRVALYFLALHVPALAVIAYVNDTGPRLAVSLASVTFIGPVLAAHATENPRAVSVVHGVTAMFMGGLLVHFGQGPAQIEMHFYFFALIAMCAVFGNPLVIVAAAATVTLHHVLLWLVLPRSVFNYSAAWWVVCVHAAFVLLDSIAACFIARSFFDNVIGLEKIVKARTDALDSKNRDMRLLLDNVQQGFVTLDTHGMPAVERSAAIDAWFGAPAPAESWVAYLERLSPSFAARTRMGWDELIAGIMPTEVTLAQMPAELSWRNANYRFEYRAIGSSEPYDRYLVIATDVTTDVQRELAEVEQRESMLLFERTIIDRSGVESFFEEADGIIAKLGQPAGADVSTVKRLIHTLKGNAALYGLTSIAERCHALEDFIGDTGRVPHGDSLGELKMRWMRLAAHIGVLLGALPNTVEIDTQQFLDLEQAAHSGEAGQALLRRIHALKLEATEKRLAHFREQATAMAERLGKAPVCVEVQHNGVRLERARWAGFWGAFVHAIRNALDHGIETPEARLEAGKLVPATLWLRTYENDTSVVVEIADNGRGIDWALVEARAKSAGLSTNTRRDLEQVLFVDGISTAASITDVSGRGVGMGALLAATRALGGHIHIDSMLSEGTTVRFTFPQSVMQLAEPAQPVGLSGATTAATSFRLSEVIRQ